MGGSNFLMQEVAEECKDMNWGAFKPVLTDALIDHLHPIQVSAILLAYCLHLIWSYSHSIRLVIWTS